MLTINLGVKPLSVFGLIHTLSKKERESLFNMYRHLYIDLATGRAEQGFCAFMADFVIDFGPIGSVASKRDSARYQAMPVDIELESQNLGAIAPETRRSSEFPVTSVPSQ